MHAAQSVGHTVRSGTCSHVVGVQGAAGTTTRSYAEVCLAGTYALLLVSTCGGVLETGGVGRVTGDGNVYVLVPHDGNTFANVVCTIAVNSSAGTIAVCLLADNLQLAGEVVELGLYIGETVDTADDHGSVLAKTVQDAAQGLVGWS